MFKETDRINTPEGPGTVVKLKRSSYSQTILFYIVKLDSGKEYYCPINYAEELNESNNSKPNISS